MNLRPSSLHGHLRNMVFVMRVIGAFFIFMGLLMCGPMLGALSTLGSESLLVALIDLVATSLTTIFAILVIWWSVTILRASFFIQRRQRYRFCRIAVVLLCLFVPFGTILGLWTRFLLQRDSIRLEFDAPTEAQLTIATDASEAAKDGVDRDSDLVT